MLHTATGKKILFVFKLKAITHNSVSPIIAKSNIKTGTIIIPADEKMNPHKLAIPIKERLPTAQTKKALINESVATKRTSKSLIIKTNSVKYHILIINSRNTLVKNPPDMGRI